MSGFMNKLMGAGAALTIVFTSYASASTNPGCPQPSCDPCANWCDNFKFDAAWLYWKASGDKLDYAVVKKTKTSGTNHVSSEKIHDVKESFDDGFKIGLGFDIPCKGWDVYAAWTHYDTKNTSHLHVNGPASALSSVQTVSVGFPVVDSMVSDSLASTSKVNFNSKLSFRYNVVDVELGKWCCCAGSCVTFRPHVGLRFADIQEKFSDAFAANELVFDQGLFESASFHTKNEFKGAGLRAGLDVDLCLCDGFSIIGKGAASSIWGRTHLKNHLLLKGTISEDPVAFDDRIREENREVRFITDLSLGFRYNTSVCGCYPVAIELTWEHHYLFGQHRFWVDNQEFGDTATSSWKSKGNLALQGLTLDVGFDF